MVRSTKNENEVVTVMIAAKRPQKGEISLTFLSDMLLSITLIQRNRLRSYATNRLHETVNAQNTRRIGYWGRYWPDRQIGTNKEQQGNKATSRLTSEQLGAQ